MRTFQGVIECTDYCLWRADILHSVKRSGHKFFHFKVFWQMQLPSSIPAFNSHYALTIVRSRMLRKPCYATTRPTPHLHRSVFPDIFPPGAATHGTGALEPRQYRFGNDRDLPQPPSLFGRGACGACPGLSGLKTTRTVYWRFLNSPIIDRRGGRRGGAPRRPSGGVAYAPLWRDDCRHRSADQKREIWPDRHDGWRRVVERLAQLPSGAPHRPPRDNRGPARRL